ncbi:SNF2-related protein [Ideonella sp.]|uniref:SNF2-related protein n=1 Tax=Ideonella sp. TaxID=1929293 RepID=UPI0037C0F737
MAKPKPKSSGLSFTTPSGQPWPHGAISTADLTTRQQAVATLAVDEARVQKLLDMMVLMAQSTTAAEMTEVLKQHGDLVDWPTPVTEANVRAHLVVLRERGLLMPGYSGRQELSPTAPGYRESLVRAYSTVQPKLLLAKLALRLGRAQGYTWSLQPEMAAVGYCVVRAHLWLGRSETEARRMLEPRGLEGHVSLWATQACSEAWLPELMGQADSHWLQGLLLTTLSITHSPHYPLAQRWLEAEIQAGRLKPEPAMRLVLGMALMGDARGAQADALLGPDWCVVPELASAVHALKQMQAGDLPGARATFAANGKALRAARLKWAELLPPWLQRLELLAWLNSEDRKDWEVARKLCVAASGRRLPDVDDGPFGAWVQVIDARLGKTPWPNHYTDYLKRAADEDALLQLAWLGKPVGDPPPGDAQAKTFAVLQTQCLGSLLAPTLEACERLGWPGPEWAHPVAERPARLFGAPPEPWRDALQAILNLGAPADTAAVADKAALQWAWSLSLDEQGRPVELSMLEMSTGARGAVKLKPLGWLAAQKRQGLPARDSAVLRHLQRPRSSHSSQPVLNITGALQALKGHPHLMLEEAPQQWLEMVPAQPRLLVKREGEGAAAHYVFEIDPPIKLKTAPTLPEHFMLWGDDRRAAEDDRAQWRVVRVSPEVVKLIHISPAQQQVADLITSGWRVPAQAQAELNAALQALASHFELQGDAQTGRQMPAESRLRAQLAPAGEGLTLRLVVQPFGDFGPLVVPGMGRSRMVCVHDGDNLWCERNLGEERRWLASVLEGLPMLDPEHSADQPVLLDEPDEALSALDRLPGLPGVVAIDWPKGRAVNIQQVHSQQMSITVGSGRDWLALEGEVQLDEDRVISLQQLLGLMRGSSSRFVTLAEGQVLALSDRLRQQLKDLDGLAQTSKKAGLQLPHAAAAWLSEQLDGVELKGDKAWRERVDELAKASQWEAPLPRTLQAELRDYQRQGYQWMARLSRSGLGACLADDMGLGKTVQTLALLLQRAKLGPALVLAPTSVCSNWRDEIHRFAPSLEVHIYHEASDRPQVFKDLGPGHVLVASYGLAQQDGDAFTAHTWASLVLDEAQALKNAATKRAQIVSQIPADFRLALSGTPVENRLSELWSLMNILNPGLLGSASQFQERFAGPIERQQDPAVRQRLRRTIAPFLLRRTKAQVLQDLPPRTEIVHLVQPSEAERALQEALRRQAREEVEKAARDKKGPQIRMLAELMKLRRAACDPRLVVPEMGLSGAKIEEFERLVQELVAGQHKALVFSQFTDYLKLLAERLESLGVAYQYLDGSTPAAERGKRVAAFQQGQGEVFLISLKAGGFGLNLTVADYVIIVDPWWNPAAEDQASGRAHRMGQQRPVTVYRLVTQGSVEERILQMHHDKRSLADSMLNDQDGSAVLDAEALAELLRD